MVQLERAIYEFIDVHNDDAEPFRWTKSADEILRNVQRFCERNPEAQGLTK